ncbi:unnamed protein product [Effrenium voratum]|nr:unnamed protein product [Effrenium voratum]
MTFSRLTESVGPTEALEDLPKDEPLLLPIAKKGSETACQRVVTKKSTMRSSPFFGQRFVTGEESEGSVTFEIAGLATAASPRVRTLARLSRELASSSKTGRFFFHLANAIELVEHVREPKRRGFLADLVGSNQFGGLCMSVILLNAIIISYMSDHEMKNPGAPTPYVLMMIELGFGCFYAVELLLKLAVHRLYFFINEDMRWNIFDLALVCFSGIEIFTSFVLFSDGTQKGMNLTFLRLLRLCKIAKVLRVLRTLRFFRELRLMLDCVLGSVLNAIWCIAMLFFVMFIFSLLLVQGLADYLGEYARANGEHSLGDPHVGSELLSFVFLLFVALFTISVWNIVTSTFVEKALKLAQPDLESLVMEHHLKDVQDAQALIVLFCSRLDCVESSNISYPQFKLLAEQHRFRAYLSARGIDIKNVEVFFRMLATASGNSEVEVKVLANALVRMKGFATSIDLQTLNFETKITLSKQAKAIKEIGRHCRRIERLLDPGAKGPPAPGLGFAPDGRKPTLLKKGGTPDQEGHKSSLQPRDVPEHPDPKAARTKSSLWKGLARELSALATNEVMPSCQDTGTAIAMVKKGANVLTDGKDEEFISRGVYKAYAEGYLRYSQVKLASCKYLDGLPVSGNAMGRAFRDLDWEEKIKKISQELGIGAQFGGKYFLHDVRVVRLPRHGASCPVGIGVSCSADRQAKAKINEEGVFLEKLETEPAKYLPDITEQSLEKGGEIAKVDLNKPMEENLKFLDKLPVSTRLALTGTIIVARDIAHAKMQEMIDSGKGLPEYIKQYPVYYAGPAKTPAGMPSGSFGPTTSGRMDQYVEGFQSQRGSMIMIGKGNRSKAVTDACKKHGGFYLGSIGGVAATLSANSIKKVEVLDMEELGMEAVWKIEVQDFPAFVVVDNKGNDFFKKWSQEAAKQPETDSFFEESQNFFFGLDKDHDGKITAQELVSGLNISHEKAAALVKQFDVDHDGGIDIKEFELMLLKNEALREQLHHD